MATKRYIQALYKTKKPPLCVAYIYIYIHIYIYRYTVDIDCVYTGKENDSLPSNHKSVAREKEEREEKKEKG